MKNNDNKRHLKLHHVGQLASEVKTNLLTQSERRSVSATSIALTLTGGLLMGTATAHASALDEVDFGMSGYIKVDSMFSNYSDGEIASGSIGRDFYIPSLTPVGGNGSSSQFDAHIRQTRVRFTADTDLGEGEEISGVLEFDMQVVPDGNERISNSHQMRVRHAYIKYKNWTIGQTWTTFQDVKALPETLDFIGVTDAVIFNRQPLIRYSHKLSAAGTLDVALENPESTITPFQGGGRIVTDDNAMPDFVLRYTHKAKWGHVAVAGMARQLSYDNGLTGDALIDDDVASYGLSVTGKVNFGQDDLRFMFAAGSGLGRYAALNVVNGAVIDANNELEAIDSMSYGVAYRHWWTEKLRSTFTFSQFNADNDIDLTGASATESTYSTRVNLMYSINKRITAGGEYAFAKRTLENDLEGDMNRVQFSATYKF